MTECTTYVLHTLLRERNPLLPFLLSDLSQRRLTNILKTCSTFLVLYLLNPNPCESLLGILGLPKTCQIRDSYSCIQSRTVIRNRPNIIAINLEEYESIRDRHDARIFATYDPVLVPQI